MVVCHNQLVLKFYVMVELANQTAQWEFMLVPIMQTWSILE